MRLLLSAALCLFSRLASPAVAQDPVAERAVAAAKEYVKAKNLKDPKLTILLSSLYNNSFPDFAKKWEELTGVKFEIVPLGYTDIPAKIMQEAVSKTGVYDIFNDFPYTMPDAAGAKVIIPLDEFAKKYKPDFSGIADGLKFQQYYDGKLYVMVNDGDHLLLVVRKDLVENPQAKAEYKAKYGKDLGCPDTSPNGRSRPRSSRPRRATRAGASSSTRASTAARLSLGQLLLPPLPGLHEGAAVRQGHEAAHHHAGRHPGHQGFRGGVEYMPKDIQGWGTPQIYPLLGQRASLLGDVVPLDLSASAKATPTASSRASSSPA